MAGWEKDGGLSVIGRRLQRVDGVDKVTGRAKYTYDISLPGMLYGKILRCPYPQARLLRIDASRAKRHPGVQAVLTDLASDRTLRFGGEEVVAVAAISEDVAEDALELIQVEYEELPFVVNVEEAMQPDSPKVYESGNVRKGRVNERGDLDRGFGEADVIVEGTYKTQVQTHTCLETHGVVAKWEEDELTVWASTQALFGVRNQIASHFGIPASKVRVITEHMGGGFGSKLGAGSWSIVAVRLAKESKAPVKLMLSRKEDFLYTGNRPSSVQYIKAGAKRDGTLTAFQLRSYGTGGIGGGAGFPAPYIYSVPNFKVEQSDVFINAGPSAAMRAPGHPQASFGMESVMDELAQKIEMDPLEFRRKNDPSGTRQKEYTVGAEKIGWVRRKKSGSEMGRKRRGVGMGSGTWGGGGGAGTQARVTIHPDGSTDVTTGSQDLGTGTWTVVAAVAAEELGLQIEDIKVYIGDTVYQLPSGGSGGSTTAASVAPAVKTAAASAKGELFQIAAPLLGAQPEELEARDGNIYIKSDPSQSISWKRATAQLGTDVISVQGGWTSGLSSSGVAGTQFAEVEVDTETGQVKVIKVVAVQDFGLVVNRLAAESQINGGVVQGLSYALLEDRILDGPTGLMVNPNLEAYKIAGSMEMPEIEPIIFDEPERGVIGLGEPPVIPTAGAIANAVANAIGVRIRELPITPDKVLAALS